MKTTVFALALTAAVAAFAQGKVTIQNDDVHLIIFTTDTSYLPPGLRYMASQPIPTTASLPDGAFLVLGLYAGTSVSSMKLVTAVPAGQTMPAVVPINSLAGTGLPSGWITPTHAILPFEGGTVAEYQVKIWDSRYASFEAQPYGWFGESAVFTMTAGLSTKIPYPAINNGGGTTWASPIPVGFIVPEPSTFALAGLGAAAMLIFRRRH